MVKKNKHIIPKETKKWIDTKLSKHMMDWSFTTDCRYAKKTILADICADHTNHLIRQLSYKDRLDIRYCWNQINIYIWKKLEREVKRKIKGQFR